MGSREQKYSLHPSRARITQRSRHRMGGRPARYDIVCDEDVFSPQTLDAVGTDAKSIAHILQAFFSGEGRLFSPKKRWTKNTRSDSADSAFPDDIPYRTAPETRQPAQYRRRRDDDDPGWVIPAVCIQRLKLLGEYALAAIVTD